MKQCLLLLTLLGCACYSFCQTTDSLETLRDHYVRISKQEATAGIILASGGLVLGIIGVVSHVGSNVAPLSDYPNPHPKAGVAALTIGEIAIAASIPLLVITEIHRSKARHLSLDIQKSSALLRFSGISPVFQPALTLTVNLSKRKRTD